MPSIRALTLSIPDPRASKEIIDIIKSVVEISKNAKIKSWTVRITLGDNYPEDILDKLCNREILVSTYHRKLSDIVIDELFKSLRCSNAYASIIVDKDDDPRAVAEVLLHVARELGTEATTRIAFSIGGPIETPYYPLSVPMRYGVSIALRYSDLLLSNDPSMWLEILAEYLRDVDERVREALNSLGIPYLGIDASLSPWMEESVVPVINKLMSYGEFPDVGSASAIYRLNRLIAQAVMESRVKTLGFNEVMLAVGEDNELKKLVREQKLSLGLLSALSAYCVAGVDMVAVPGNLGLIASVVKDVMAAHEIKRKILGFRAIPVLDMVKSVKLGKFGSIPVIDL